MRTFTIFTCLILSLSVHAATKNILDYYLSIPLEKLEWVDPDGKKDSRKHRLSVIKTKDVSNGYIELKGDDGSEGFTLALFKSELGPILAITKEGMSVQQYHFYLTEKNWQDVTGKVFPTFTKTQMAKYYLEKKVGQPKLNETYLGQYAGSIYRLRLPRKGTTISIIASVDEGDVYGQELLLLKFNGTSFKP